MDTYYASYHITYPFQITRFRSVHNYLWDSGFAFPGESHNFWEFICVVDGDIEVVSGNKVYILKSGNFISHPPMEFHRIRNVGDTQAHVLITSFEHQGTFPSALGEGVFLLSKIELTEYRQIFRRLTEAFSNSPTNAYSGAEVAFSIAAFLIRLSQLHKPYQHLSQTRSSIIYQKVIQTMLSSLHENLSLQEIADKNSVSVSMMKKLFHTYTGMGPKKYYCILRGNEAMRLLKNGMDITQIADLMNYSSPNYFSLCFKNQFGVPPGQYRKEYER